MKKSGWLAIAGLALSSVALAQESGAPRPDGAGLVARVDFGRGSEAGLTFRVSVSGGAPGGVALLCARAASAGAREGDDGGLRDGQGRVLREWLPLDAQGRGELTARGVTLEQPWRLHLWSRRGAELLGSNVLWLPGGAESERNAMEVQRGDIVITEIMKDPTAVSDTGGEWFELYNFVQRTINIEGWALSDDGSNFHVIDNNKNLVWLAPGQRIVLGNNADPATNGGVAIDYEYSGFTLSNGADEILLTARNGKLVDVVRYDDGVSWPDEPGKALNLDPNYEDAWRNDNYLRWCSAKTPIGGGPDAGTPGQPNDPCP